MGCVPSALSLLIVCLIPNQTHFLAKYDNVVKCDKCGVVIHKQCISVCNKTTNCTVSIGFPCGSIQLVDKVTVKMNKDQVSKMIGQVDVSSKLNNDLEKQIEGIILHSFVPATIPWLEICDFCGEKIISISISPPSSYCSLHLDPFNPAYQCKICYKYAHKSCCASADTLCPCIGYEDTTTHAENQGTFFKLVNESKKVTRDRGTSFFTSLFNENENSYAFQQSIAHGDFSEDEDNDNTTVASSIDLDKSDSVLSSSLSGDLANNLEGSGTRPKDGGNASLSTYLDTIQESYRHSRLSLSPTASVPLYSTPISETSPTTPSTVLKTSNSLLNEKKSKDSDEERAQVLAQQGILTVLVHEAKDLPVSSVSFSNFFSIASRIFSKSKPLLIVKSRSTPGMTTLKRPILTLREAPTPAGKARTTSLSSIILVPCPM